MGFFGNFIVNITSIPRTFINDWLPAIETILTEAELEKAIRSDEAIIASKNPVSKDFKTVEERALATIIYNLAVNYYRKVRLFSPFDEKAINRAIACAHQVESFFTMEKHPFQWEQLQEVLAVMYLARGQGIKGENLKIAIFYLENWLEVLKNDAVKRVVHANLIFAYGGALEVNKEIKKHKIEEHYAYAVKLSENSPEWIDYLTYLKINSNIISDRKYFDIPAPDERNKLPEMAQAAMNRGVAGGIDWLDVATQFPIAINNFRRILESILTDPINRLSDRQTGELMQLLEKSDYYHFMQYLESVMPEKYTAALDGLEELIQEYIKFIGQARLHEEITKFSEPEAEVFISILYILKAGLCQHKKEMDENWAKAEFYFESSRAHKSVNLKRPFHLLWEGKYFASILYFPRQKWDAAAELYKKSLEILEDSYKVAMGKGGRNVILSLLKTQNSLLSLDYAFVLAKLGKVREAVILLEKWRGRELNERLDRNSLLLKKINGTDLQYYRKLCSEIDQIELAVQNRADDYLNLTKQLRERRAELEKIIAQIREYFPDFILAPDFSTIQKAAKPEMPLAYILPTLQGSLLLIVTSEGEIRHIFFDEFTNLKAADLFDELQQALAKTRSGSAVGAQEFAGVLKKLGEYFTQALIAELKSLNASSICLVPCGILSQFPWHAATTPDGQMLLDYFDVSYAPTAKFLLDARQKLKIETEKTYPNPKKFIGIADPTGNLKYAASEVRNITDLLKKTGTEAVMLKNEEASKEAIAGFLPSDVVHFACHGTFNASAPLDSALILCKDEELRLREMLEQNDFQKFSQSRLVVLSACQTALVDINEKPEENIGLPLGFISRGVPGVIGTLWSVNDESSALLMTKFYEIWLNKQTDGSPAKALRAAQGWLRVASDEDINIFLLNQSRSLDREARIETNREIEISDLFKNPYFWAGFVFIGI